MSSTRKFCKVVPFLIKASDGLARIEHEECKVFLNLFALNCDLECVMYSLDHKHAIGFSELMFQVRKSVH